MTVVDTSAVVDYLVRGEAFDEVAALLSRERMISAPDLLVFEVVAVLRRHARRGLIDVDRAGAAVADLGDLSMELFPTLPFRGRAWELRDNLTVADAIFVALAERLDEPLATKDAALASAAQRHTRVHVIELAGNRDR